MTLEKLGKYFTRFFICTLIIILHINAFAQSKFYERIANDWRDPGGYHMVVKVSIGDTSQHEVTMPNMVLFNFLSAKRGMVIDDYSKYILNKLVTNDTIEVTGEDYTELLKCASVSESKNCLTTKEFKAIL